MRSSGKKRAARCSGAASHRLVGVLLLAGATAATARRAAAPAVTPAVPELMENARPAQQTRRRLSGCDYVTVSGSNSQSGRHGLTNKLARASRSRTSSALTAAARSTSGTPQVAAGTLVTRAAGVPMWAFITATRMETSRPSPIRGLSGPGRVANELGHLGRVCMPGDVLRLHVRLLDHERRLYLQRPRRLVRLRLFRLCVRRRSRQLRLSGLGRRRLL